jgi:hypothetical protein
MNKDCYSTACKHGDGSTTEIHVHIHPDARRAVEEISGDSEEMVKGCVWRLIALKTKSNEVTGSVVEFTIDEPTALELVEVGIS